MVETVRRDWPKLIAELEAAGITVYKISLIIQRPYFVVKRWKSGAEPRHYEGEALLALHSEYIQNKTSNICANS